MRATFWTRRLVWARCEQCGLCEGMFSRRANMAVLRESRCWMRADLGLEVGVGQV